MREIGHDYFQDTFRPCFDPVTAAIAGTIVYAGGQLIQGIQDSAKANREAEQAAKEVNTTYTNAKNKIIGNGDTKGDLELLHDQERQMHGSLTAGTAASGIKVSPSTDPQRAAISEGNVVEMGGDGGYKAKDVSIKTEEATSTLDALRNQITNTYNRAEADLYSNLALAKQGKDTAEFNISELKTAGEQALWGGVFDAGSTILTGFSKAKTPVSQGGWGIM